MAATQTGSRKRKPPRRRLQSNATRGGRTKKVKKNKKPARSPLHGLQNSAKEDIYRSRLPELNDPYEEPCMVADPMPEGYIFVARGDPYVTRNCKIRSKATTDMVFIVYDSKAKDKLGIRVKKETYEHVTELASQTADKRAAAVLAQDTRDEKKAQKILKQTFPDIPPKCAKTILQHAFLKGSGRVGRSTKQPDTMKARLAVEAHIRHQHTSYDSLLGDGTGRDDARAAVRKTVHALRDQWAGKSKSATVSKSASESISATESISETEESSEEESPRRMTRLRLRPRLASPEVIVID